MRVVRLMLVACVALLSSLLNIPAATTSFSVPAAESGGGSVQAAYFLNETNDGMGQYGAALQQASSPSATLQALLDWHAYVVDRSAWGVGLSSSLLDRLANADWNARQAGAATITAELLATATTNLVNSVLATMSGQEQEALYEAMMSISTVKGVYGLNSNSPYVSGARNSDGTWTVTISAQAFSDRKLFYQQTSPGMVSSGSNFYPGEAIIIFYSLVSGDLGFGGDYITLCRKSVQDMSGVDMTNNYLFGENGYMIRRPLQTFLTEQAMSNFFSELGF